MSLLTFKAINGYSVHVQAKDLFFINNPEAGIQPNGEDPRWLIGVLVGNGLTYAVDQEVYYDTMAQWRKALTRVLN